MKVTAIMIKAAQHGEYDYYRRGSSRTLDPGRFIPTPDAVIRAMLEAAVGSPPKPQPTPEKKMALAAQEAIPARIGPPARKMTIVTARKPKPRSDR